VKRTLKQINMDEGRVEMFNLSSAEGPRFAEIATKMTERAKALGPSPLNPCN
jgi:F420-non-reducing hydrogenase iron-sulfur subunit